jgi:hypothetical protein
MDAPYLVEVATPAGAVREHHVIACSLASAAEKVEARYVDRRVTVRSVGELHPGSGRQGEPDPTPGGAPHVAIARRSSASTRDASHGAMDHHLELCRGSQDRHRGGAA